MVETYRCLTHGVVVRVRRTTPDTPSGESREFTLPPFRPGETGQGIAECAMLTAIDIREGHMERRHLADPGRRLPYSRCEVVREG